MAALQSFPNARPLAIFAGYLATAAMLTMACLAMIVRPARPRRHGSALAMALFSLLAALSLASTWYYMFSFFHSSYLDWKTAQHLPPHAPLRLGDWLRDSALFKQAWAATLQTPGRAFWALQIFGFCANWSLTLAVQGTRKGIARLWVFVLLGQVVAISFAMNLSFLAMLSHASGPTKHVKTKADANESKARPSRGRDAASLTCQYALLGVSIALGLALPDTFSSPRFMWLLMIPHILAFASLLLPTSLRCSEVPWLAKLASQLVIVAFATTRLTSYGDAADALFAHPAVSSVGSDVLCCWLSYAAWYLMGEAESNSG
ncbi:hypothetical protein CDD81_2089 [Ophiocordyceps australis]|uniref:Uncharacterized protein n=1 Tax=Ophiocordyceps australis TaxID=1399860 RepID=A0A2C5XZT1_9HYPO|nr:hypothetical protein CDD81_2089 [Ophiocordyceps australis]